MLSIDRVSDTQTLASLEEPWRRLVHESGQPGPFCDFDWQLEWWRALGEGRTLSTFVASDSSGVVGILPAFEERREGARSLSLIGSRGGGGDYLDAPSISLEVRKALLSAAMRSGPDLLEIDDVDFAGPLRIAALEAARERGLSPRQLPRFACPFIPLSSGYERVLSRSGRRENLRRRRKWLASLPGFRIECADSPDEVAPFLERFTRLHAARWAQEGGSQAFPDARLVPFHRRVAQRMARAGTLRLWTLYAASDAVAVAWTFDDRSRAVYYQSGFLPSWGSRSVGLVLFAAFVEDACRRGMREVDLLRGSEPYKFEWTHEGRLTASIQIPLSARGLLALELRRTRSQLRKSIDSFIPVRTRHAMTRLVREARLRGGA